ncbi:replication initiation protein [Rhizobium leguminosarum]|uniref:replication initiation protein n=1 Tax=Rhizobium leguminosarum TaxID=384 RepID=UPI001C94FEFE|nr:replication initiation protein [Rhizobium leguminosarum]MBY5482614.1 replication initiation protein [Rhizobium leguminosarum]
MSAKSHALYEYLMASARIEIAAASEHSVPFADAMAFLDTPRSDRIREYIDAINKTYVSYDFTEEDGTRRAASRIQLLACEDITRPDGERAIGYRMHPSVRKVILAATQYAHLEVAAFARFRCKYSARLYPKLAYVAGLDEQHPTLYKPEELADELGYVSKKGKFHWGHFENDCLKPAMDDMFGAEDGSTNAKVRRFVANYDLRRSSRRGRPVEAVVFSVGRAKKHIGEEQKPKVVSLDRARIRKIFEKAGLDHVTETPNEELLAQAAGRMKVGIVLIAQRWAATVSLAKEDPDLLIGSLGILSGGQILNALAQEGVRAAFIRWLTDWKEPTAIHYRAAAALTTTSITEVPEIDSEADGTEDDTDLDYSTPIMITLASGYRLSDGETMLREHAWSGDRPLTIRLCAPALDGTSREQDVEIKPTALDLGRLLRDKAHIIADLEYVA